jgi:hypothetical protein
MELLLAAVLLAGLRTGAAFAQARPEDFSSTPPETRWRAAFQAATGKEAQVKFLALMQVETDTASVRSQAYLAVAHLLVGAHRRNVFAKWRNFREWTAALEAQIAAVPHDAELRFLRMTVQANAPKFLGYSAHLASDCRMVHDALQKKSWDIDLAYADFVRETLTADHACQID